MSPYRFWFEPPPGESQPVCGYLLNESVTGTTKDSAKFSNWIQHLRARDAADLVVGFITYDGEYWFSTARRLNEHQNFFEFRLNKNEFCCERVPGHIKPESSFDRESYMKAVKRAQEYIAAGDIYQVNICRIVRGFTPASAIEIWHWITKNAPAPCASYLEWPGGSVISASPELFLHLRGKTVITMPIKGTRKRESDPLDDERLRQELQSDLKELAELVMITDLERNDLGVFCEFGSVKVRHLAEQKAFSHVRHLVSTIEGTLRDGITHEEILFGCLPGGSISGAPKLRAMQIISELEPQKRGLYTGVIGWFDLRANHSYFAIVIRTIELSRQGEYRYGVGCGITAGSIPEKEWEETLWKEAALHAALTYNQASRSPG